MSLVVGRLAHVEQMVEADLRETGMRVSSEGAQRALHCFGPGLVPAQSAIGLIALISFTAADPLLLALEAAQLGATIIELSADQDSELIPEPSAFDARAGESSEVELSAALVAHVVTQVIAETGLPVITSGLDDDLLLGYAFESGAVGFWSAARIGDAAAITNVAKNGGDLVLNVAIDSGPLDASSPATLSQMLDQISELTASGENVVATILGGSDAEIAAVASLAVSRGARTLRSVRVTPAIRAALVTDAIMDAD
mgnify:CR=1 FL=1